MDIIQLALTWVGWPNGKKTCFDLRANLISTKVSARNRKSTQVHVRRGQTDSQVGLSYQLESTCDSVWPGLYEDFYSHIFSIQALRDKPEV